MKLDRILLLAALALLSSCGKSSESVIRQHRPAVEAKLALIQAIGRQLPTEIASTGGPFVLSGPEPQFGAPGGKTNAIIMEAGHFAYPDPLEEGFHLSADNPIADPLALLSSGEFHGKRPGNPEVKDELLRNFLAVRYVLVLRSVDFREPVVHREKATPAPRPPGPRTPPAPGSDTRFTPGTCEGDLFLFDIDQKKSVGGWRFYGKNSGTLQVSSADEKGWMLGDLRKNTLRSICEEFQRRFPSAAPPFP